MRASGLLFLLASNIASCRGDVSFDDALTQLPACGVQCILPSVDNAACGTSANMTCLCADTNFLATVHGCVASVCDAVDALAVARVQAQLCHYPERSRKIALLAVMAIEIPGALCLALRMYSRWYTVTSFELDDYIMMFAGVLYVVFLGIGQYIGQLAFGVDAWNVPIEDITLATKLFYVDESFYLAILALTKLSILCFYLRIFPQRGFRQVTIVAMAWVSVSGAMFICLQIFQCLPVSYTWEGWKGTYGAAHRCLDVNALAYSAAACGIAQDLAILVLPVPLLLSLNASRRSRAGVLLMFSLGIFILITSCIRLRYLILFARSANPTWDYTDSLLWSGLEVAVSVIVTSLPAIRVLLSRAAPRLFRSVAGTRAKSVGDTFFSPPDGLEGTKRVADSQLSLRSSVGSALQRHNGRHPQAGSFPLSAETAPRDAQESRLELRDRARGDVRTLIGVGQRFGARGGIGDGDSDYGYVCAINKASAIPIIKTTTTTVVGRPYGRASQPADWPKADLPYP